ncbi:DNA-binding response regulator, NarL/FixJ family, contains REC and HTH domains [Planctomicrobium piriforme]|uniref:DNA-binding response regulator, NarL/FixJ family, contains REC and HTH domains n=2 Tax=Planctomicrobium piriforme TaxID=1576369 RepID=A0A1I3MMK8_9PLAN|nr:DNA-binding response regulator, NarL/FixJ family, contains REC and HTH domains [Planctomicrobium piriforme]
MGLPVAAGGAENLPSPDVERQWKILIVDDHPLVRKGMVTLISQEPDLKVVGEAAEMQDAAKLAGELEPDLMVIDISLRSGNGLELVKQITSANPRIKMLVCSMHDESLFAERCLRAGAGGYLNKEAASDQVIDAIRSILGGKTFVSPQLAERLLNRIVAGGNGDVSPIESLTDRELEVFGLIGQGLTTRQIAERLHLSYKTIESYRENLKAKLSLRNAAELNRHAVQWALENG